MTTVDVAQAVRDTVSLVRIDSQNPGALEGDCARWIYDRLGQAGVERAIAPVADARDNVVATVRGRDEGPRLILLAHMDTVAVGDGWSVAPLEGLIRDDRIYGRGSADMKSGLAVAMNLLEALAAGPPPRADIVLCATVDEEAEMAGAHALAESGLLRADDQVLALEPTGLRLRLAQVGLRWLELEATGKMAHAGRAHLGVDANHVVAHIVDRLRERVSALPYRDDLLGAPLFTCGTIAGGVGVNVVPPSCVARLDLRFVPPMTAGDVLAIAQAEAVAATAVFPGAAVEVRPLGPARPPVRAAEDAHIVRRLRDGYRDVTGAVLESGGPDGHEAYTDASMISALTGSTSCTVFGPGSSDRAHTADEYVDISDLETAARVLEKVVADW
jgi:succinyl-diaminopimelate desuccinylase